MVKRRKNVERFFYDEFYCLLLQFFAISFKILVHYIDVTFKLVTPNNGVTLSSFIY